ncbi:MAG: hypothetical protein A3F17_01020 [Gammaproteobacteria bacterium RIFCSPHIGHO2_12_FULL_41_15]|nr:MAG: hypothetical protein A3F17_01020 [Gammaproteobacteria bacterium RIFCSPHIGHO2_12_FULL_41_15]
MDKIQRGIEPSDWKPMRGIAPGVKEIRIHDIVFQINILVKINYFNCLTGNGAHFRASLSRLRERLGEGWLLMARSFSPKYLSEKL